MCVSCVVRLMNNFDIGSFEDVGKFYGSHVLRRLHDLERHQSYADLLQSRKCNSLIFPIYQVYATVCWGFCFSKWKLKKFVFWDVYVFYRWYPTLPTAYASILSEWLVWEFARMSEVTFCSNCIKNSKIWHRLPLIWFSQGARGSFLWRRRRRRSVISS